MLQHAWLWKAALHGGPCHRCRRGTQSRPGPGLAARAPRDQVLGQVPADPTYLQQSRCSRASGCFPLCELYRQYTKTGEGSERDILPFCAAAGGLRVVGLLVVHGSSRAMSGVASKSLSLLTILVRLSCCMRGTERASRRIISVSRKRIQLAHGLHQSLGLDPRLPPGSSRQYRSRADAVVLEQTPTLVRGCSSASIVSPGLRADRERLVRDVLPLAPAEVHALVLRVTHRCWSGQQEVFTRDDLLAEVRMDASIPADVRGPSSRR
jgi:hypothetical protein